MKQNNLVTTARITGSWYLLLAISGILGFGVFHSKIFITGDTGKTLTNLTEQVTTARIRLVLELLIIASQALSAVWFYKLLNRINGWAAFALAGWGLMNCAAIMVSAIAMGAAIQVANVATLPFQEKIIIIQLLSSVIANAWVVGGLFFGLWLLPMGYVIVTSRRMPLWLGWTLIIGGVGYIVSTFLNCIGFSNAFVNSLTIPATIGEFWMIGYLLMYGIRPEKPIE